jgi:phage terminase large subunit-like protein
VVSSAGDEAVDLARVAGLELDDWQQWTLRESLGERSDGSWAAFECAEIVGRQNGKNAILEARELAGVVLFGDDLITHTAHRADTTLEHFRRMEQYAEEFDEFGRLVKHISHKNGDESIELKGGRRIRFVSRARQPGRGFSGSVVVFDEALYLSPEAIGAIVPTLATRKMAQVWYTSSAPKAESMVLHSVMARGRGEDPDPRLFYAEWGNEPGIDPDDMDAIYRANPGMGKRITEEYVRAERRLMSGDPDLESEFMRERVGVAEQHESDENRPIPLARWSELIDGESAPTDASVRLALDAPPNRARASFAIAGKRQDGLTHVSTRFDVPPPQMGELVTLAKQLTDGHNTALILPPNSPAKAWKAELEAAGVPLDELTPAEYAEACGAIQAKVLDGAMRHRGQPDMDAAVGGLATRSSGDVDTWSRRSSKVNIAPFVAATCALLRVPEVAGFDGDYFVDLDDFDLE